MRVAGHARGRAARRATVRHAAAAGRPRPVAIAPPVVQTLANGLRVIVAQRRGLPLVTAELVVRSGAETDPAALSGLADLTAGLWPRARRRARRRRSRKTAEALGGQLDSGAGWDRSFVSMTVTRPRLAAALGADRRRARARASRADELERAQSRAIDGLTVALAQPGTLRGSRRTARRSARARTAIRRAVRRRSLARVRRADVVALHAQRYPAGQRDADLRRRHRDADALALAQASVRPLGSVRPRRCPRRRSRRAAGHAHGPVAIAMAGAGQAGVALAAPSIARSAPDYYAGVVANTLLGGGYSSRLNQEIRIKRGLSYGGVQPARRAPRAAACSVSARRRRIRRRRRSCRRRWREIARVRASPRRPTSSTARKLTVIGGVSRRFETTEDPRDDDRVARSQRRGRRPS